MLMRRFVINSDEIGKFKVLDREKGKFIATFTEKYIAVKYIKYLVKDCKKKGITTKISLVVLDDDEINDERPF